MMIIKDLSETLKDCDKNVIHTKTVMIQGKEHLVSCYPMVKDNPNHYQNRKQLIDTFNKKRKHKVSNF